MIWTLHTQNTKHLFIFVFFTLLHNGYFSWLNKEPVSTLPDGVEHVVAACQEDNLFLQCRNRYNKLLIKDIFYGRDNEVTCKSKIADSTSKCENLTPQLVKDKVRLMCDGEYKCKVPVTTAFLEKEGKVICPSISKYVRVQYICNQEPKILMVCQNGCPNSCWPGCKRSCCTPAPPPPPPLPPTTCPVGCPEACAPMCSTSCCETQTVAASLPSTPTLCPGSCPSDCAPMCTDDCCRTRKTTSSMVRFNQPPPTIQYNRHQEMTCSSMCSPSNCLPSCSPACCVPPTVEALACPGGCSNRCAPACSVSCCSRASTIQPPQLMLPPPPPPPQQQLPPPPPPLLTPAQCPGACAAHCAPLCSPTCCQSSQVAQRQSHCGTSCSYQCAPLCSPTCCNQITSIPQAPVQTMPPIPQLPPQPIPQYPSYQVPLPPMPMLHLSPQQKGCPVNCLTACLPGCPPRCCIPNSQVTPRELQQRKTYQQMLQRFRAKQMQAYYGK